MYNLYGKLQYPKIPPQVIMIIVSIKMQHRRLVLNYYLIIFIPFIFYKLIVLTIDNNYTKLHAIHINSISFSSKISATNASICSQETPSFFFASQKISAPVQLSPLNPAIQHKEK